MAFPLQGVFRMSSRFKRGTLFAAAVLSVFWVGTAPVRAQDGEAITVVGTLTDEGAECPAMRGDDGETYTLTPRGSTEGFETGDRVRVTGAQPQASFCQQGVTIAVESIESAE